MPAQIHGGARACGPGTRELAEWEDASVNLVLTDIGQLVTNDEARDGLLGVMDDAAVVIDGGTIGWVGREDDLPGEYRWPLPGTRFVNPHRRD